LLKMASDKTDLVKLISEEKIREKVNHLARQIANDYKAKNPILIGILKGSYVFLADLSRKLEIEHCIEFMKVASYDEDPQESGNVKLLMDLGRNISGKDVVIVEDIVDSGRTLNYIYHSLLVRNPRSLEIVTLLDKSECREVDLDIKYIGFKIPNRFVIGYGLDEEEAFRGLPYIAYRREKG